MRKSIFDPGISPARSLAVRSDGEFTAVIYIGEDVAARRLSGPGAKLGFRCGLWYEPGFSSGRRRVGRSAQAMIRLSQVFRRIMAASISRPVRAPMTEYNEPGSAVWHRTGFMHRQRYAFASRRIAGKRVLNVACGPGYAEQLLMAGEPAMITAVDYDRSLIARLQSQGAPPRIEYRHADAETLPDSLGKFDVIISFENIEHLRSPELFLAGVGRLSQPGAKLILSTPNRLKYSDHPEQPFRNPFHVREYDFRELVSLLAPYVTDLEIFGQIERKYMGVVDELGKAIRSLNSLWIVRLEREFRRLVGRPAPNFNPLSFETDLLPLSPESSDDANTFVVVGTVCERPEIGIR
jgi:2-polyprenyl-3-methyl-5-hydroxy-6-metoxy-1,4-benzoquinol methylase